MSNEQSKQSGPDKRAVDEFTHRVMRYLDGLASPEEFELLKAELNASVGHRRRFVDLCQQARTISEALKPIELADAGFIDDALLWGGSEPDVLSEVIEQALDARRRHEIEDAANKQLAEDLRDQRQRSRHARRIAAQQRSTRVILIPKPVAALGVGLIAALVMLAIYLIATPSSDSSSPVPTARVVTPRNLPGTPRYVATLTGLSSDVVWADRSEGWVVGMELEVGEIHLTQGTLVVELKDGAEVTLHAPVRFSVLGTNASELHAGMVYAEVPDSGHGFEVFVPGGVVTDWGSSVAMITADSEARTDSHVVVSRGSVQLTPRRAGRRGEPVLLRRNQFASVSSDGSAVRAFENTNDEVQLAAPSSGQGYRHGETDPRWRIRLNDDTETHPAVVVAPEPDDTRYRHLHWWIGSPHCSQWIGLRADGSGGEVMSGYGSSTLYYTTTLNIPENFDADSIVLGLKLIADNQVIAIRVNGRRVAGPFDRPLPDRSGGDAAQYQRWIHHTLESCFEPGDNTLEFEILNDDGPAGVRIEMQCTGTQRFAELD
ncbi:hypothetical protein OT109_18215 [Phycisphaeraceae bacterium D3-23]